MKLNQGKLQKIITALSKTTLVVRGGYLHLTSLGSWTQTPLL
jgi:hypothetical protein